VSVKPGHLKGGTLIESTWDWVADKIICN